MEYFNIRRSDYKPTFFVAALILIALSVPSTIFAQQVYKLNDDLESGGFVQSNFVFPYLGYEISADGQYVIYHANQQTPFKLELYGVRLSPNQDAVKLNHDLGPNDEILGSTISADSTRVLYFASEFTGDPMSRPTYKLYSLPITGGTPVVIDSGFNMGSETTPNTLFFPSDNHQVAYANSRDSFGAIYRANVDGTGTPTRIDQQSPTDFWQMAPDRSKLVYIGGDNSLYSVGFEGNAPTKINTGIETGTDMFILDFSVEADSQTVIFRVGGNDPGPSTLYSATITGQNVMRIDPPVLSANEFVFDSFLFYPQSLRVYTVQNISTGESKIIKEQLDGSNRVVLDSFVDSTRFYSSLVVSDNLSRIVYRISSFDFDSIIYSVPVNGVSSVRLSLPDQEAGAFLVSPDGSRVVYAAISVGFTELYTTATTSPDPKPLVTDQQMKLPDFSGADELIYNNEWVLFQTQIPFDGTGVVPNSLFTAHIEGSEAIALDDPSLTYEDFDEGLPQLISGFIQSNDGGTLVFDGAQRSTSNELFAINLDFLGDLITMEKEECSFFIIPTKNKATVTICL